MSFYANSLNFSIVHHYMLADVMGSLAASVVLLAIFMAPGYCFGWLTNLYRFRTRGFAEQGLWSIAGSMMISPLLCYGVGRAAGLNMLCVLLGLFTVTAFGLILYNRAFNSWPVRQRWATCMVAAIWTAYVLVILVDFQHGTSMYFSTVMADQSYRIAFTEAVARTGVPPANPLYFSGTAAPMRYYYFWYVLCAVAVKLAHVTAQQAFIASSIWAGFGLLATVQIFSTDFFRWQSQRKWLAVGLLAVMGADIVPAVGNAVLQSSINGDIEWWSVDPIDAWPDSLLWVPHHVASVLCCLLAFLLLWRTLSSSTQRDRRWSFALAGVAYASSIGLSVYVAIGFVMMMFCWAAWLLFTSSPIRATVIRHLAIIALLGGILSVPFLRELTHNIPVDPHGTHPAPLVMSVRRMIDSGLLTGLPIFASWNSKHPVLLDQGIRLVLVLPGLAMELGLYGAVLVYLLRDRNKTLPSRPEASSIQSPSAHTTSIFLTLCGLLLTLCISSSVISNNDFGYRAVMLPMFFLTLLTAEMLGKWKNGEEIPQRSRRIVLSSLLWVGIAGTVYGTLLLRLWLPQETLMHPEHHYEATPTDEYQLRTLFENFDHLAPPSAVVAIPVIDPDSDRQADEVMTPVKFYQRMLVMNVNRQILNAEMTCATQFGGNPDRCKPLVSATQRLYALPLPSAAEARQFCRIYGADYLLASHRDAGWRHKDGWMDRLKAVSATQDFSVMKCK